MTHIKVWENGVFRGYIKSVNYNIGTFSITKKAHIAKKYTSVEEAQYDIDFCSRVMRTFYVFTY